jgi:hypothetical protein
MIKAFFKRLVFHSVAIIIMFLLLEAPTPAICAYIGLVCVIPRDFNLRSSFTLIPAGVSLGHFLLAWLVGGIPWGMALFWAGLQTWVLRFLNGRCKPTLDWFMLPLLLAGLHDAIGKHPINPALFALCTAIGYLSLRLYQIRERKKATLADADNLLTDSLSKPFQASLDGLIDKKKQLPQEMQPQVASLCLSTESILRCMDDDPACATTGARFLERYLPSIHMVVDEYLRLKTQGEGQESIQAELAKSENLLARMADAFHEEHGNLLRKDTLRFKAELNVLDKLLKMDGR